MTQTYNIAIANSGTAVRKGKMLEIYYGLY